MAYHVSCQVYCTNCFHFRMDSDCIPSCEFDDMCEFRNFEDSMNVEYRPFYIDGLGEENFDHPYEKYDNDEYYE